jgi:membrane protease YdiL (CAAX protease family)
VEFGPQGGKSSGGLAAGRPGLVLVGTGMLLPTFLVLFYFLGTTGWSPGWQQTAVGLSKLIQFSLPLVWWFSFRRKRGEKFLAAPPGETTPGYLATFGTWRGVGEGLLFGLVVFGVILGAFWGWFSGTEVARTAGENIHRFLVRIGVTSPGHYLLLAAGYSLIHAGLEEIYWRWFVFGGLLGFLGGLSAVGLAAASFTAHHVVILGVYFGWGSGYQVLFSLGVFVGGAYWCWLFLRSGSLVGPWLSHVVVDVAIFVVGYYLAAAHFGWIGG